jgi:hypothetical protein
MTDGVDIDLYADVESEFQHDDFATENNDLYDDVLTAGSKVKKMPRVAGCEILGFLNPWNRDGKRHLDSG